MASINNISYDTSQFERDLEDLGIRLSERQIEQFLRYYELLTEWNEKVNLTAITEYEDVLKKHFVDSLSLVKVFSREEKDVDGNVFYAFENFGTGEMRCSLLDVGTGAGFPGLALKIAFPKWKVTLLDSLKKRIVFLDEVIRKLELTGVTTIHGRAEDFAIPGELRESFDLCVSRAVANLSTLSEYCLPYVRKEGLFVAYKSEKITDEIKSACEAVRLLGGKVDRQVDFLLPGSEIYRNLVVIKKCRETPKKFPRKAGLPAKEPLKQGT